MNRDITSTDYAASKQSNVESIDFKNWVINIRESIRTLNNRNNTDLESKYYSGQELICSMFIDEMEKYNILKLPNK